LPLTPESAKLAMSISTLIRDRRNVMTALPDHFQQTIIDLYDEQGTLWLKNLPNLIADLEAAWSMTARPPVANLSYNYVAPAVRADGSEAILKLGVPNPELTTEIEALRLYDGRGSARLLAVDPDRGALLLERLKPGDMLVTLADDDEATRIAARVMRQLWQPVLPDHPFPTVHDWAAGLKRMRHEFDGGTGPLPAGLVAQAETLFAALLPAMAEPVLLHGDCHHYNILRAEREPWLAIDPKGIVGEPAYEVGAVMRNYKPGQLAGPHPERLIERRIAIFAEEWGFERDHLLAWSLAQAVLSAWWSVEDHGSGWEDTIYQAELMARLLEAKK
jgi:streptomycin 6-kinase